MSIILTLGEDFYLKKEVKTCKNHSKTLRDAISSTV